MDVARPGVDGDDRLVRLLALGVRPGRDDLDGVNLLQMLELARRNLRVDGDVRFSLSTLSPPFASSLPAHAGELKAEVATRAGQHEHAETIHAILRGRVVKSESRSEHRVLACVAPSPFQGERATSARMEIILNGPIPHFSPMQTTTVALRANGPSRLHVATYSLPPWTDRRRRRPCPGPAPPGSLAEVERPLRRCRSSGRWRGRCPCRSAA